VWCHQAVRLEHHLDHSHGDDGAWRRLVNDVSITPTLANIADRHIAIQPKHRLHSSDWRHVTEQATAIHTASIQHAPPRRRGPEIELGF